MNWPCWCPQDHGTWRGMCANVAADMARVREFSPFFRPAAGWKTAISILLLPNLLCLLLYRVAHMFHVGGRPRTARAFSTLNLLLCKVNLPPQSCIGAGCFLPHPAGVTFHGIAGEGLTLFSMAVAVSDYGISEAGPNLGHHVTVGGHAVLLGAAHVGDCAKIAPTAVLTGVYPANTIVVSNGFGNYSLRKQTNPATASTSGNESFPTAGNRMRPGLAEDRE